MKTLKSGVGFTCGTSSCHVHNTQAMWCLVIDARPEHFHGYSSHLLRKKKLVPYKEDKQTVEKIPYILRISLSCIVRASHNKTIQGRHGTIASLFSLPQHHRHWFWSEKCHLPDTMCSTSSLNGMGRKIYKDAISTEESQNGASQKKPSRNINLRYSIALWVFLCLSFSISLCIKWSHVMRHLNRRYWLYSHDQTNLVIEAAAR